MKKNPKLINILSWVCVIIILFANYLFVLPVMSFLFFIFTALASSKITLMSIYLLYLIISQTLTIIPTLFFLILDKKLFKRNFKCLSIINTFICLFYSIWWYLLNINQL